MLGVIRKGEKLIGLTRGDHAQFSYNSSQSQYTGGGKDCSGLQDLVQVTQSKVIRTTATLDRTIIE